MAEQKSTVTLEALLSLPGDSVLLMPNDASARQVRDKIASLRGSHDQAFLESVSVVPLDQWLVALWDGSLPQRQVLRPIQLLALARQLIEDSEYYPSNCLSPLAICRQFVDAFQLRHEYLLSDAREHYLFSEEYQAFAAWAKALQSRLDNLGALASQQLPTALLELLAAEPTALPLPDNLIFSEDLDLSPAAADFVRACLARCQGYTLALPYRDSQPVVRHYVQRRDECSAVAGQIALYLKAIAADAGPLPQVAVIVPDFAAYHSPLHSALCRQLYPAALFPLQQDQRGVGVCEPWVFEGREKLLGFPLLSAAWDIISLEPNSLPLEQLSRVLRSRFIRGWAEWRGPRASLDLRWREWLGASTSLQSALAASAREQRDTPEMLEPLLALAQGLSALPRRQLPSAWVRSFDQLLLCAGWPNAEDDDPVVMQCRRGFSQAMDVFRAMDRQLGEVAHGEALSWLQHILSTKRFSISRDWDCPIRIMTLDDALGREFDAVWVLGMDDNALPRRVEPSPFLPLSLQRAAKIPASDPGLLVDRDRRLLMGILRSAPEVNISFCAQDDTGVALEPSSLLRGMPVSESEAAPGYASPYTVAGKQLTPDRDEVSGVSHDERKTLRGGSGLFKEYAVSPFFAFAKYRLRLREFPELLEGLDHRVQGMLVHACLQYFWEETKDKTALDAMSSLQVFQRVEACVSRAFELPELASWRFPDALIEIEKKRITTLVSSWLIEKEKNRLDNFRVIASEEERRAELMGIPLRLRIDRIDEVASADGPRRLVIDYKTGAVQGRALNSDQLTEPQLPIYALIEAETEKGVDGVMLAQLKSAEELSLHMRSNWANSVVKKRAASGDVASEEAWENELKAWSTALQEMASGILAGNILHDYSVDHGRGFSAHLLPLLRGEWEGGEE
jgi:ATP-dependent helicase/nuclease subunit B